MAINSDRHATRLEDEQTAYRPEGGATPELRVVDAMR
jgi:hypothetical protein